MSLFFVNSQQLPVYNKSYDGIEREGSYKKEKNSWYKENELDGEGSGGGTSTTPAISQTVTEAHQALLSFWPRATEEIRKIHQVRLDVKTQALPLARIKKIMKLDEDVKMISAEAPMLFSKAAELFIHELTLRAWIHTEDNKRRTLQRNDIAMAITKYDQFDFLIDIVPRDEIKTSSSRLNNDTKTPINPDQVHYYFQLAQQHQAALQQSSGGGTATTPQTAQATVTPQTIQIVQQSTTEQTASTTAATSQPQMVQLQTTQSQAVNNIQLVQQVVTANGEIQNVPIQLSPSQLQMIRMQLAGGPSQPIIVQAAHPQLIQVNQQNSGSSAVFLSQAASSNNQAENE